jgi:hypothetical protein
MDKHHTRMVLATNATSAANCLADMTPTSIVRDTVVQTNREGELPEYREIKTTEQILHPTLLDASPSPSETTTRLVEEVPGETEYVLKQVDEYEPLAVLSDTTPFGNPNNDIVGITSAGSLTTPGKIVGDMERVLSKHHLVTVAEPAKRYVTSESTETTE